MFSTNRGTRDSDKIAFLERNGLGSEDSSVDSTVKISWRLFGVPVTLGTRNVLPNKIFYSMWFIHDPSSIGPELSRSQVPVTWWVDTHGSRCTSFSFSVGHDTSLLSSLCLDLRPKTFRKIGSRDTLTPTNHFEYGSAPSPRLPCLEQTKTVLNFVILPLNLPFKVLFSLFHNDY